MIGNYFVYYHERNFPSLIHRHLVAAAAEEYYHHKRSFPSLIDRRLVAAAEAAYYHERSFQYLLRRLDLGSRFLHRLLAEVVVV